MDEDSSVCLFALKLSLQKLFISNRWLLNAFQETLILDWRTCIKSTISKSGDYKEPQNTLI